MPYRLSEDKRAVEEQQNGVWKVKKRYGGSQARAEEKAKKFLAALEINVPEAHGAKK